jgi:hypothetical protein
MRAYWRQQIADILAAGVADGTFRGDLDPEAAAFLVIGVLIATSIYRLDDGDGMDRAVAELFRSVLSDQAKADPDV